MPKIFHIQPALPRYRLDFFERLSQRYGADMRVWYSPGSLGALTSPVQAEWAIAVGPMRHLPAGLVWQPGIAFLPVRRGDVVVLSGNPRYLSTLVLLLRARLRGAHVVWWGHYWSSTSRRWRQLLRYLPMALAHALLFYTDDEVEAFRADALGLGKGAVLAALNNGIDIAPIRALRTPYLAPDRDRALLFIGRLTVKADLALGLEALARMGPEAPVLHVVGDGETREALEARVAQLGLGEKVVWHGALTDEARIAAVANRCQAFLYPGEVGLSLIHAMAYGLPALVHDTRRHHMPEIAAFRDGVTGQSFRHGDAAALAVVMQDMLADASALEALSGGARAAIGPDFTTEGMAARFEALVRTLEESR